MERLVWNVLITREIASLRSLMVLAMTGIKK